MTANEFLNFRTDLANLSKFERQIGKSQPIESMAKLTRGRFNEAYRHNSKDLICWIKNLYAQIAELSRLSKGFVDKTEISLMQPSIGSKRNRKGKDLLLNRLEETVPGITQKSKS